MFSVAIVGRPNVGKSTLFNKLTGKRLAIVGNTRGITRDCKTYAASLADLKFKLIDTAGLEHAEGIIEAGMLAQSEYAMNESDVIIFMVDGAAGLSTDDITFVNIARAKSKPVILVANKCDSKEHRTNISEFYGLGLGEPILISATNSIGFDELYIRLEDAFQEVGEPKHQEDYEKNPLRISIVGRPNVGKSTLFNTIVGFERMITSDIAGTTRDAVSHQVHAEGYTIDLIDTAGMRRRSNIKDSLESMAVGETINAVRRSHLVVMMTDANEPLQKQDLQIIRMIINEGRGIILVINKCDLIEDMKQLTREIDYQLESNLRDIKGIKPIYTSALHKKNIRPIFEEIKEIESKWQSEFKTAELNRWLQEVTAKHNPPLTGDGRRIRLKYMTQVASKPPTFKLFCNAPEKLPKSYTSYLVNDMRKAFNLEAVPIRFEYAKTDNPYER
jgi:GTP-binding protein